MFIWRHVPVYRKNPSANNRRKSAGLRLNVHQTKPAVPVRVEGVRMQESKLFTLAVITPDGAVHPFHGKHGNEFIDFWNEWREIYRQQRDYEDARGIPREVYCPRCDEKMHWLKRASAKYVYKEITAKRSLYAKINMETMRALQSEEDENSDSDDEIDPDDNEGSEEEEKEEGLQREQVPSGPMEDRYCCPNDECGIREARVEFKHNCANVVVLNGLTSKQWKPNKFGGGRKGKEKSARAKARLAEQPFLDKGYSIDKYKTNYYKDMPYMNGVTHEEAIAIVEAKAKARYEKSLKGDLPKFNERPFWYNARYGFRYSKNRRDEEKVDRNQILCDECNSTEDTNPSVCFSCGCVLCRKCRHKHLPLTKDELYYPWGTCPGCNKKAGRSLDMLRNKNLKSLDTLIKKKPGDHRIKIWQQYLRRAQATNRAFKNAKDIKLSLLLDLMLSQDPAQEDTGAVDREALC
jgi:hypothetical protein